MQALDLIALLTILKSHGVTYFKDKDLELTLNLAYSHTAPKDSEEVKGKKDLTDDDILYWSANK